jgi:hypothetical protein
MTAYQRKQSHGARKQHTVTRLLKVWDEMTPEAFAAGIAWYGEARNAAREMHPNVLVAAGVIAALSPRQKWDANKRYAGMVCRAALDGSVICPKTASYGVLERKAWAIATMQTPTIDAILKILNGDKITRFFRNIIGDDNAVTVDVWAARAAGDNKVSPSTGKDIAPHGLRYAYLESAYQIAAQRVGVTPREFQAAIWCFVRGKAN